MDKQEYDKGYQAALEAIKSSLQKNNQQGQQGNAQGSSSPQTPPGCTPPPSNPNGSQQGQGQQEKGEKGDQGEKDKSGSTRGTGNKGVVRPEDCQSSIGNSLGGVPDTAGGMLSKSAGDKLAKEEGYDDTQSGNDESIGEGWSQQARKEASKLQSTGGMGSLKQKLDGLYKVSTDWKKKLQIIVGRSLSEEEKRQAYANKNILVSQNRIARTDKDKFDNVSSIAAIIDTSGSLSDDMLKLLLSHVYKVALAKKPLKLIVIQCDTAVQSIDVFKGLNDMKRNLKKITLKGGGGTDMRPAYSAFQTDKQLKQEHPELVMVFTDGWFGENEHIKRSNRISNNLCWVIIDNPSFEVKYKDSHTKVVYVSTSDLK